MTKYAEIDRRIIAAIEQRKSPLYDREVNAEARWLATQTAREDFRIIDGRLQALRKANVIVFKTKQLSNGKAGWHLAGKEQT